MSETVPSAVPRKAKRSFMGNKLMYVNPHGLSDPSTEAQPL